MQPSLISVLKPFWTRTTSPKNWEITGISCLPIDPKEGFDSTYFEIEHKYCLLSNQLPGEGNVELLLSQCAGTAEELLAHSIVPVVALDHVHKKIRCIGTGFFISCSGLLATACHVLLDPEDSGYGGARWEGSVLRYDERILLGVLIPNTRPRRGYSIYPIEQSSFWGNHRRSPLFHVPDRFEPTTDVAICKVTARPDGLAHQPLNLSLNPFQVGEYAYSIGYAEMEDVSATMIDGQLRFPDFTPRLIVSVGPVVENFPSNHRDRSVSTPGPCFHFESKIPGKMSGAPILGGEGTVVRGVVCKSLSSARHAYGSMFSTAMTLPLFNSGSLKSLMEEGSHGMTTVIGV